MEPIIKHFTDTDVYKLNMCCTVLNCFPRAMVKYQFIDRNNTIYPEGFAEKVKEQIKHLENLRITEEEIAFLRSKCYYLPDWFYTYLRGFRYSSEWVKVSQDKEGHLIIDIEGYWHQTILLEVQILAIISELYHTINGDLDKIDFVEYERMTLEKARKMLTNGLYVMEFGTRRRFCMETEDIAVRAFIKAQSEIDNGLPCSSKGKFMGTSNVYLAMKYNVTPMGTCAHEYISAIAGMYGPQEANYLGMKFWQETFGGALGIWLYDTYTWKPFSDNFTEHFARVFNGLRVDSGKELEQLEKIMEKYRSLRIDPSTKQIIYSNALDTDKAIELHKATEGKMLDSYGIGTHLTADGKLWGIKPNNIVIKLIAIKMTENRDYNDTCKMSEDKGKVTGNPEIVNIFKHLLHLND
ncbi:MAG: nicotinate phosphoribosyltransferase [Bacilli bacterium]|nr:nicotinate phosphoribosyltransferase [Bacilli bacterium]